MRTIWNPWHGCRRVSEGCAHCYMYFLDRLRGADGSRVYTTEAFDYPVRRDRKGRYAVPPGVTLWVCMTSDFFLEEADVWRADAWRMMRERCDVAFLLITKRVSRIAECLPSDWGSGYENVICYATAENQKRAAERVPLLLELPFAHRGVACSPLIGAVDLSPWLGSGKIERVMCGGENYDGARPCRWEWVTDLASQCRAANVSFTFFETGNVFVKDGKTYRLSGKRLQAKWLTSPASASKDAPTRLTCAHPWDFLSATRSAARRFFACTATPAAVVRSVPDAQTAASARPHEPIAEAKTFYDFC